MTLLIHSGTANDLASHPSHDAVPERRVSHKAVEQKEIDPIRGLDLHSPWSWPASTYGTPHAADQAQNPPAPRVKIFKAGFSGNL
jgi:hypothetical protein